MHSRACFIVLIILINFIIIIKLLDKIIRGSHIYILCLRLCLPPSPPIPFQSVSSVMVPFCYIKDTYLPVTVLNTAWLSISSHSSFTPCCVQNPEQLGLDLTG